MAKCWYTFRRYTQGDKSPLIDLNNLAMVKEYEANRAARLKEIENSQAAYNAGRIRGLYFEVYNG